MEAFARPLGGEAVSTEDMVEILMLAFVGLVLLCAGNWCVFLVLRAVGLL